MSDRWSARCFLSVAGACLAAVLSLLAAGAASADAGSAARPSSPRLVIAPTMGQLVHSDVVRIAVRSGNDPGELGVRLNGVAIGADFALARGGVRVLNASLSYGLRPSRNVLVVTVRPIGGQERKATVDFKVQTGGPLVGAGLDRRVVIGDQVDLGGRIGSAGRNGRAVRSQWQVVGGPTRGAQILDPASPQAAFKASAPGEYTLRLRARTGSASESDWATVTAVRPNPLITVHTLTRRDGKTGIQVGSDFYAADPPGNARSFVQVLRLDRRSTGMLSNTTDTDLNRVKNLLASLGTKDLAIISVDGANGFDVRAVIDALRPVGFPEFFGGFTTNGSISVIGYGHEGEGDAEVNLDGALDGYLTADTNLNYRFISPERVPFGYPHLPARCDAGQAKCNELGFVVKVLDSHTGDTVEGEAFETDPRSGDEELATDQAEKMAQFLNDVPRGDVVGIETDSERIAGEDRYPAPIGKVDRAAMVQLADAVASIGGTRNGFNRAALQQGPADGAPVYSLVGWAGAGEGRGAEAAIGIDGAGNSPYLNGVLRRDSLYEFRPDLTSNSSPVTETFQNLILQPPKNDWPLSNDPGATAALNWIGEQEPDLGSHPRAAYWTQSMTQAQWLDVRDDVRDNVHYPGGAHGFNEGQFDDAKTELLTELSWVGKVRAYMTELSQPFATQALTSWSEVNNIATEIYQASLSPHDNTGMHWTQFTSIILKLLGPFTASVGSELGGLLDLGMWAAGTNDDGSAAGGQLSFEASELGVNLQRQALEAVDTYGRLGDIIVSDYAKLKEVGTNAGCNPTSPACNKAFAYDEADRVAASGGVYRSIRRLAYEKLAPLGFNVYALNKDPSSIRDRGIDPDPTWYACRKYYPFADMVDLAQSWTSLLEEADPINHINVYQTYVIAKPPGRTDEHATAVPAELLHQMFDPVEDTGNPKTDGVGISPDQLMGNAPHHTWDVFGATCRFYQP